MKVRDYSDTTSPNARKVGRPGGPQKRIDLTPASGRSRCGAPTMTLRYAQPPPEAPAPSRETARFQWQVRRGTRGHPGARGTDESRAIPRTTRVLHALPNVPKLDVAGSTPVARSRENADLSQPFEGQREKARRRGSLGARDIH